MKVFKFGGASVNNAAAVKNVAEILKTYPEEDLVVVISAMGKTTNALERLAEDFFYRKGKSESLLEEIKEYHFSILHELFSNEKHEVYQEIHNLFVEIEWQLEDEPIGTFDFEYDQMVSVGELLSTKIISAYLIESEIANQWMDARDFIRTDNTYRNAVIDWSTTEKLVRSKVVKKSKSDDRLLVLTQGFIASTSENFTATLGREGSDFSAAIIAHILEAEEVIIWKDVEGMFNADPKFYRNTVKLNNISYLEAIELAYFGASVIHPKTIKPLQNKNIPLRLKSFLNPQHKGSLISGSTSIDALIPSFIHKPNQLLISISALDFSFIAESNLRDIYGLFFTHGITINLMQNAAISFSVCVDYVPHKTKKLIEELQKNYKVSFNEGATLITIRHYTDEIIEDLLVGKTILLEQKTRNTARFVAK